MSASNELHLMNLMCTVRGRFKALLKAIQDAGYETIITSSYRSDAHQRKLFQKYKAQKSGRAAKNSKHPLRIAIDINLKKGDKYWRKTTTRDKWVATGVPLLAKGLGFRWGGDFSGNYDPVHFDLGNDFIINKITGEIESVMPASFNTTIQCLVEDFLKQYSKQ